MLIERFNAKHMPEPNTGCWLWTANADREGYGRIQVNRRSMKAHRVAYELFVGPIPNGLTIDHVRARGCLGASCVNPEHLEAVTKRENTLRGRGPSAVAARRGSCKNGHPWTPRNTYRDPKGGSRVCRSCNRAAQARRKLRGAP